MSHKSNKPVFAASAALAGSLVFTGAVLASSAFAATPLAQGYMLGAQDAAATEKTAHEGKCGEGMCGMDKMDTDKDGQLSPAEFAAAHDGDSSKFAAHDGNGDGFIDADEMKAHRAAKKADMPAKTDTEGKCGEGKCGSM
ncbi:HvfA family oxazolone/thioamide-modified RiPP metallophore [Lysobacter sp. A286]